MMSKAMIVTNKITLGKPGPLVGLKPAYWTKQGVTVFFFEEEWVPDPSSENAGEIIPALPGMVGVSYRGNKLYTILADGECVELTNLDDDYPRHVLVSAMGLDQLKGEVPNAG